MKLIDSWSIVKYPNGVICLIIKTIDKWVKYHQYNNIHYEIKLNQFEERLEIPEFLEEGKYYLKSHSQNKYDIYHYFMEVEIPYQNYIILNSSKQQ